jgi:hypothetical protein
MIQEYNYTGKKITNVNVKRLFLHNIILHICEAIMNSETQSVIYFKVKSNYVNNLYEYYDPLDIDDIIIKTLKHIQSKLPIVVFIGDKEIEEFINSYTQKNGNGYIIKNYIMLKLDEKKQQSISYERIRKFCDKNKLTFLNKKFFNELSIKAKLLKVA